MDPKETLSYFESRSAEMQRLIHELVDIESPSYDEARSLAVVDWLENAFRDAHADVQIERQYGKGFGQHVVVRSFPGSRADQGRSRKRR